MDEKPPEHRQPILLGYGTKRSNVGEEGAPPGGCRLAAQFMAGLVVGAIVVGVAVLFMASATNSVPGALVLVFFGSLVIVLLLLAISANRRGMVPFVLGLFAGLFAGILLVGACFAAIQNI